MPVEVRFQIWDTAGEERFRALAPMYYKGAVAALCIFDQTNYESFQNLNSWIKDIDDAEMMQIAILSNKCDILTKSQVNVVEAEKFAKDAKAEFFMSVSAKDDIGIDEAF